MTTSTSSVDRVALDVRGERVVAVPGEVRVVSQVADVGAALDQPLVAFGEVLGVDGLGVERRTWTVAVGRTFRTWPKRLGSRLSFSDWRRHGVRVPVVHGRLQPEV